MTLRWKCLCVYVCTYVCVCTNRLKKVWTGLFIFFCLSSLRRFVGTVLQNNLRIFTTPQQCVHSTLRFFIFTRIDLQSKKKKIVVTQLPPPSPLWKSLWTLGTCRLSSMPNSWTHHRRNSLSRPDIKRPVEYSCKSFFFIQSPTNEGLSDRSLRNPPHTPLWHLCRHLAGCFRSHFHNLLYCLRSKACPGLFSNQVSLMTARC